MITRAIVDQCHVVSRGLQWSRRWSLLDRRSAWTSTLASSSSSTARRPERPRLALSGTKTASSCPATTSEPPPCRQVWQQSSSSTIMFIIQNTYTLSNSCLSLAFEIRPLLVDREMDTRTNRQRRTLTNVCINAGIVCQSCIEDHQVVERIDEV